MIAKPGWSRRYGRVLYAIGEAIVFFGLIVGIPALIWLLAPEGAAYPR